MVGIKENPNQKNLKELKQELETISKNKNSLIIDNELEEAYKYRKKEASLISKINKLELSYKKKY